jgi:succinate dehydrogenase/fumarate reductase cytochrome b subunit
MNLVSTLTLVHVVLSLIGIGSGLVVVFGLLTARTLGGWTAIFLITTVATSATGFLFPFEHILPAHGIGIVSLALLGPAMAARYLFRLEDSWRRVFVICSMIALYLNVLVGVVQAFMKIPSLRDLAPTQTETPFVVTQVITLLIFVALTVAAAIRFKPNASVGRV